MPVRCGNPRPAPHSLDRTPRCRFGLGRNGVAALLGLLSLLLLLESFLPLATAVRIGADEDFEISKVTLCMKGYKLYTEIWNDQPPLNTSILIQLVRHISPPILGPRLFSVASAAVLLASLFLLVNRVNGLFIAVVASAMVLASPGFVELSGSCMQEIPALAPIMAALCTLVIAPASRQLVAAIMGGALFGFALQIKLIGVVYLPIAALIIYLSAPNFRKAAISLSLLAGSVILAFVGLNALTGNSLLLQLQQSWASHFSAARSSIMTTMAAPIL